MYRLLYVAFAALIVIQCNTQPNQEYQTPESFAVIQERDLIPEGTAYDPVTDQVFISSMYKRKIIAIRKDGSHYDFISEAQDSIWATIGMQVDSQRRKLWVLSGKGEAGILTRIKTENGSWDGKLYCYDIDSARLVGIYSAVSTVPKGYCFNDLTVTSHGDVLMTESLTNKIFSLPLGADSITIFLAVEGYSFLNGITLTPDSKLLFVSSSEGILSVDLKSKHYKPLAYTYTILPRPIDGLSFYDNSLIGHQSMMLTRFYLNTRLDSILSHERLDSIGLNSSTTGEIGGRGWYYYIANSQLRSGIDYEKMQIMPWDSLEPVVIKRIKL